MKKIIAIMIATAVAAGLGGCGAYRGIEKNGYYRFKTVATYKDGWEVVDKDTGFGYFIFNGGGGTVILLDEDGNPYRENGWRDYAP